jgi:hypothetical protein
VPGVAPVQRPRASGGFDAGQADGRGRQVGDGVDGVVELGEDRAGRGAQVVEQGAEHAADLGHRGGGVQVVADDVTDDGGADMVRQEHGVVPVAADVPGSGGRPVHGGGVEGGQVRQGGQEQALEAFGIGADPVDQPGIVDGHARGTGQGGDEGFVLGVEGPSVVAVGQVQVPVYAPAHPDGDAQQSLHRRMAGREPGRVRMRRHVVDAQGCRAADQAPEQPAPARQRDAVQGLLLRVGQPHGDELGQQAAVLVQDAQRAVAGVDQVHRGGDDAPQHGVEFQMRADRGDRVQEPVQLAAGLRQRIEQRAAALRLGIHPRPIPGTFVRSHRTIPSPVFPGPSNPGSGTTRSRTAVGAHLRCSYETCEVGSLRRHCPDQVVEVASGLSTFQPLSPLTSNMVGVEPWFLVGHLGGRTPSLAPQATSHSTRAPKGIKHP